jgi:uncharacterized membrane protein
MVRWTLILAAAGFVGAGVFYSPYIGFNGQTPLACPVCPTIFSIGHPALHFVEFTVVMGIFNAILFVIVGLAVRAFVRLVTGRIV